MWIKVALFGGAALAAGVAAYYTWNHFTRTNNEVEMSDETGDGGDGEKLDEADSKSDVSEDAPNEATVVASAAVTDAEPPKAEPKQPKAAEKKPEKPTYCGFKKGFLL